MTDSFHYVYEIIDLNNYKKYIGSRTSKVDPENDLGILYFSSSKDIEFKKRQKNNPNDFLYNILGIFNTRKEAIVFESSLHNIFKVSSNPQFYNLANQLTDRFDGGSGSSHFRAREILQCSPTSVYIIKEWSYIEEASKYLGINSSDISSGARGRNKLIGGYIWIYKDEYNQNLHRSKINVPDKRKGKRHYRARAIYQCEKNTGKIIKKWDTITDAANFLRINPGQIKDACVGRQKTSHGFIWKYKENTNDG